MAYDPAQIAQIMRAMQMQGSTGPYNRMAHGGGPGWEGGTGSAARGQQNMAYQQNPRIGAMLRGDDASVTSVNRINGAPLYSGSIGQRGAQAMRDRIQDFAQNPERYRGNASASQGGANQMMQSMQQPDLQTIERLMQMLRQAGLESQMDRMPTLAPSTPRPRQPGLPYYGPQAGPAPRPRQPGLPRYAPQGGINPMAQRRGNARIQPGLGR